MQGTVLQKIVDDKLVWIAARKTQQPLAEFKSLLVPSTRNFYQALTREKPAFILECKKASPSKGLIRENFDPVEIATVYRDYASAISVLTDEEYFQGNFDFLPLVSQAVTQPILCKDFIVDPYQIWLARYYQADAILLMLSVLTDQQYRELAAVADSLNMGVLTEVSNPEELQRAIALNAKVIGINNRDLRDLSVNLDKTRTLAPQIPEGTIIISESGINHYAQIQELRQYVNGFLVGSSLMSEADLAFAVKRLLSGENKVCGLTRPQDVQAAYQAGALYGGLIFAEESPRKVNLETVKALVASAPLQFVGVYRNQSLEFICQTASQYQLAAVQLHGDEDQEFVRELRQQLADECAIWKAFKIEDQLPERHWPFVDRYLFDHGNGGTGQAFDWQLLKDQEVLNDVILAGGINPENCAQAITYGCAGLDINSGIESSPGIKDVKKLTAVFQTINSY